MSIIAGFDKKSTTDDIRVIASRIESRNLVRGRTLTGYADIAELMVRGELDVEKYRLAAGEIAPDDIPFLFLYMDFRDKLSPFQREGWDRWGMEIIETMYSEKMKFAIHSVISEK
jgi:hypothetical protein